MSKTRVKRFPAPSKTPTHPPAATARRRGFSGSICNVALPDLAIGLALVLSIFVIYGQVDNFEFINYDDGAYVFQNAHVQRGLTPETIRWALTAVVASNWMPVTLLSHLLDVQLFGLKSGMHHLVNVCFHALSSVLLFMVFRRATGARGSSAFVAFIFALHPLHVESVAWIAERKDVLSAFLFSLALYGYVRYTERPSAGRYLAVAGLFCLGLMSKPMMVTFPFVLLLFDFWPLRRWRWPGIVWEKIPLFALSAADSVVTYLTQGASGAVSIIPFDHRVENALVSYAVYVGQTLWPLRLAVFYPYQRSIPLWQPTAAAVVFLVVSVIAILAWRTRPYLTMGWFWYVGTLVPVIGLVQAGAQSHADRYMYVPMIGLSVMLAWGAADVIKKWPGTKYAIAATAVVACGASMIAARTEAAYWQNDETLFRRATEVTEGNWVAESNLGHTLMSTGRAAEAIPHFEAVLRVTPQDAETINNLGGSMLILKRYADAIPYFESALRIKPELADAHYNLGMALAHTPGREADAVREYETALRLRPDNELAHNNLGLLLLKQGRTMEALAHFETAVRLRPEYGSERNLGDTLLTIPGRQAEAIAHLEAAQRLNPNPELADLIARLRAGGK